MDKLGKLKYHSEKAWQFFWKDDSIWSWIVNIIVAFLVIRYFLYPILGIVLGTSFPIVAVVSESMEHGTHRGVLCGQSFAEFPESPHAYWQVCGEWYEDKDITQEEFFRFPFRHGFYKGDVIILWRADPTNLGVGDILVFQGNKPQPIIHRIVKEWEEEGRYYYHTKGDHNSASIAFEFDETRISEDLIYGKGIIRIPYLGWLKILFVDAVKPLGIVIER